MIQHLDHSKIRPPAMHSNEVTEIILMIFNGFPLILMKTHYDQSQIHRNLSNFSSFHESVDGLGVGV